MCGTLPDSFGGSGVVALYYEARHEFTNNSEMILLLTNVHVIGQFIPR